MRAVAREVGVVSSAVFRYFPTRDDLLTAMVIESYGHLEAALADAARDASGAGSWVALGQALRDWGRGSPHEFHLIYGTPVPGYVAPPETIPAAEAVARHFLDVGGARPVEAFDDEALRAQMQALAPAEPSGAAAVLAELAALVGFVSLELSGHFVGTADPADALYAALLRRQVATLGVT